MRRSGTCSTPTRSRSTCGSCRPRSPTPMQRRTRPSGSLACVGRSPRTPARWLTGARTNGSSRTARPSPVSATSSTALYTALPDGTGRTAPDPGLRGAASGQRLPGRRPADRPARRSALPVAGGDLDADLRRTVRRTSYLRQLFYVVVLLVALAGQVSGAVQALGIP